MTPEYMRYGAIMLAAGIGIPVLAALNAALGARIASPAGAATCLFLIAFLSAFAVMMFTQRPDPLTLLGSPKYLFLGGVLTAFYVLSITWVAPHFGIGNAIMFVLLGQLISAALIDQFGLFGAVQTSVSPLRGVGLGLMLLGVVLTQRG